MIQTKILVYQVNPAEMLIMEKSFNQKIKDIMNERLNKSNIYIENRSLFNSSIDYELNQIRDIQFVTLENQNGVLEKYIYDLNKINTQISNLDSDLSADIISSDSNKDKLNLYKEEYIKYNNLDGLWMNNDTNIKIFCVSYFNYAFVVVSEDNNFKYHICVKIRKNSEENNKYILSKNNSIKFELNKTTNDTWLLEYKDKQYEKIESDLAQNRVIKDFINQNDIFKNIKDIINLNVSYKYVVKYKLLDYLAEYNTIRNQLNNPNMLNRKAILEVLISNIILLINAIKNKNLMMLRN